MEVEKKEKCNRCKEYKIYLNEKGICAKCLKELKNEK
jgi:hypothetical protein